MVIVHAFQRTVKQLRAVLSKTNIVAQIMSNIVHEATILLSSFIRSYIEKQIIKMRLKKTEMNPFSRIV